MNIKAITFIGRQVIIEPRRERSGWPIAVIQADPCDPNADTTDRKVRLTGDDWVVPLPHHDVNEVTVDDVRAALKLPDAFEIMLISERAFPDFAWISTEMLDWMDDWRREAIAEAVHIPLAKAS